MSRRVSRQPCSSTLLIHFQRLGSGRRAVGAKGYFLDACLGILEHLLAMGFQMLAAFIDEDRFLKIDLAAFELVDNGFELPQGGFEIHLGDIGVIRVGHQSSSSSSGRPPSPDPRMSAWT